VRHCGEGLGIPLAGKFTVQIIIIIIIIITCWAGSVPDGMND
jgi:hypothetical protein